MANTKFYAPAFARKVESLDRFLQRNERDMVQLNAISGTELTQLQALATAVDNIMSNPNWPKYRELS